MGEPVCGAGRGSGLVLSNGNLRARITNFGASLADLRLTGHRQPLVLGFESSEAYHGHGQYFGAVIGRYANRIANARCTVDGRFVALESNEGPHHLHGGAKGFAKRDWAIEAVSSRAVSLFLLSPDGDGGFPGTVEVRATYSLVDPATLRLDLEATADAATPVNLCHHPYFNLAGEGDIGDHLLTIHAERYLPAGLDLVPTGEIAPVAKTPFDFTRPRKMREAWEQRPGFNNTYCAPPAEDGLWHAATLSFGDLVMELHTDQPGLHFYDGYKIAPGYVGNGGQNYHARSGLCLEAQAWPDSPNRRDFPCTILRPGEFYRRRIEYRFA